MNRVKTIALIVSLFLISSPMIAWAGIVGSAHDFSGSGWTGGEICIACHAPHNSSTTVTDAPLWNHQITAASYTTYSSPTMSVDTLQPRGPSKLCLSCHDGSVALDSFGGKVGTELMKGKANLGTDLSDDHPVSVEWQHQTVDNSSCFNCHFASPREIVFFPGGTGKIWIECATCHDVHNKAGNPNLLRKSNAGSDLCMTCHAK